MQWLDDNVQFVFIPFLGLGLGTAFLPWNEKIVDSDIVFMVLGHLILLPAWLLLFRRFHQKKWSVRKFAYWLPAASYVLPACIGVVGLIFG